MWPNLIKTLSLRSVVQRFRREDPRKLQQRLDTHRLLLYTSLYNELQRRDGSLPHGIDADLVQMVAAMSFEQQSATVTKHLQTQLIAIASNLHTQLLQAGDPMPAAQRMCVAHKLLRTGDPASSSNNSATSSVPVVTQGSLAKGLQQELGYSLTVRPSLIAHEEAGLGLFVQGAVQPGAVVALFPGMVYSRSQYRRIPGYPKVDRDNAYLIARYDGHIIDSKPWGMGCSSAEDDAGPGLSTTAPVLHSHCVPEASPLHSAPAPGHLRNGRTGLLRRVVEASDGPRFPVPATQWVNATSAEAAALEELLEGRHPLAMAHFANHPGPASLPNTMLAPFTWRLPLHDIGSVPMEAALEPWVRAYLPTLGYAQPQPQAHSALEEEVVGMALVALQPIMDGQEVLFNYRLSPGLGRPHWYVPVDVEEQSRRWA